MDAIYLIGADNTDDNERAQTSLVIGPITGATISTLVCYLRRALATVPAGQAFEIRLDLSCCTNLTIDGALGLDSARREVQKRGGTLSLTRVPPLIEHVLHQHSQHHLLGGTTKLNRSI